MLLNKLKNSSQYYWTSHVKFKMQYYGLSAQKVLGVIKKPKRKEEGIVKNTVAVMQPVNPKIVDNKTIWKQEIWVMYQKRETRNVPASTRGDGRLSTRGGKRKSEKNRFALHASRYAIISAWRYPGVSPKNNPIPEDILRDIGNII